MVSGGGVGVASALSVSSFVTVELVERQRDRREDVGQVGGDAGQVLVGQRDGGGVGCVVAGDEQQVDPEVDLVGEGDGLGDESGCDGGVVGVQRAACGGEVGVEVVAIGGQLGVLGFGGREVAWMRARRTSPVAWSPMRSMSLTIDIAASMAEGWYGRRVRTRGLRARGGPGRLRRRRGRRCGGRGRAVSCGRWCRAGLRCPG